MPFGKRHPGGRPFALCLACTLASAKIVGGVALRLQATSILSLSLRVYVLGAAALYQTLRAVRAIQEFSFMDETPLAFIWRSYGFHMEL